MKDCWAKQREESGGSTATVEKDEAPAAVQAGSLTMADSYVGASYNDINPGWLFTVSRQQLDPDDILIDSGAAPSVCSEAKIRTLPCHEDALRR